MWSAILGFLSAPLAEILKRVLPPEKMSEAERAQIEAALLIELSKLDWQQLHGQLQINLEEAKSQNVFVAGWRPFVGWTCGAALAYQFVLQPFLAFIVGVYRLQLPPLPQLDMGQLVTILLGLLGLGVMRTYEKSRGIPAGQ